MVRKSVLVFAERATSRTADLETLNAERFDGEVAIGSGAEFGDVAADEAEAGLIEEVSIESVDVLDGQTVVWKSGIVAEVRVAIDVGKGAGGIDVMEKDQVLVGKVLIEPNDALVHSELADDDTVIVDRTGGVRQRSVEIDEVRGDRIEAVSGNDVVGEGLIVQRIPDDASEVGEIARPLGLSHDNVGSGGFAGGTDTLYGKNTCLISQAT